ncbi:MAG: hypothetical protein OEY14_10305 [Myxococcales bacterium]|nr:hypothetical protein [Myxococcales bacterium]
MLETLDTLSLQDVAAAAIVALAGVSLLWRLLGGERRWRSRRPDVPVAALLRKRRPSERARGCGGEGPCGHC